MQLAGVLKGKKTYISAALTAIGAIAGYLTGDVTLGQLIATLGTAASMASLRAAQSS